jgi:hypothetical protein
MDIKELNKSQLILLAVLLSFITSIATGITTVTLMQQAPTSFTVPVNRVIKQTVEKIQQVEGKTVTQTIVVKEEDLIVDAIAKNQPSIFSISKEILDENGKYIEISLGKGLVVSAEGVLVIDGVYALDKSVYYAKNESGKFKLDFVSTNKGGFSLLKLGAPLDDKNKLSINVPVFTNTDKMKIGQKVLVYGSSISSYIFDGNKDLRVNVSKSNTGSPVFNLDGEVLGVALFSLDSQFVPIDTILDATKIDPKSSAVSKTQ